MQATEWGLVTVNRTFARGLRLATNRYPFQTPRARLLRILPDVPATYGEFRARHGETFDAYWPGRDEVCSSLFWFGDFDPWVGATLRRLARPGGLALDIGANIGATALPLARAVGPQGKVVCFEPAPANVGMLSANIAANGAHHIEIVTAALSSSEGSVRLSLPAGHAGMARITDADEGELVTCTTLDSWAAARGEPFVSVCKIDVEGHEAEVFGGMRRTLAAGRIAGIVFERHIRPEGYSSDTVLRTLSDANYTVFGIRKGPRRVFYSPLTDPSGGRPTSDFAAVLRGSDAERRLLA